MGKAVLGVTLWRNLYRVALLQQQHLHTIGDPDIVIHAVHLQVINGVAVVYRGLNVRDLAGDRFAVCGLRLLGRLRRLAIGLLSAGSGNLRLVLYIIRCVHCLGDPALVLHGVDIVLHRRIQRLGVAVGINQTGAYHRLILQAD